jgi:hypothetical protein
MVKSFGDNMRRLSNTRQRAGYPAFGTHRDRDANTELDSKPPGT